MALDLSPERFGSKAAPEGSNMTGEEIMAEAERIAQVRKDAKIIAQEVIKELNKREAEKEAAETVQETFPTETISVAVVEEDLIIETVPILSAACGFLIGILITSVFFSIKIKKIRQEHEKW